MTWTLRATIMQTPAADRLEVLTGVEVTVGDDGVIVAIDPAGARPADVELASDEVLIPGLVDLHVHAPQFPQLGIGLDLPLEHWLFEHTFPLEARCEDLDHAQAVWDALVPTLVANGTTTAVYYGSIHEPATEALAATCLRVGQRAWVGRVAMDHPEGTPSWYRDASAEVGIAASERSIDAIRALDGGRGLVAPMVTPRFVPACSDELLAGLGELARRTGTLIQTHCSESDWEHGHVLDRFGRSDAEVLDGFGLLQPSTVLAHAGHLDDRDRSRLCDRGAGIAHCPLSNIYFGDGVFPLRRARDAGVNVGLGTDIAGGPSASIFDQARHAVAVSRMLDDGVDVARAAAERGVADSAIDTTQAFWLATVGGANVLGAPVGLLEVGRPFDAVAVSTGRFEPPGRRLDSAHDDDAARAAQRFERMVRLTQPSDIGWVWVNGRLVQAARRRSS